MGLDVDISLTDIAGISLSAGGNFLDPELRFRAKVPALIGVVSFSQQALYYPTSCAESALKVSNVIFGIGRALTAYYVAEVVKEIFLGKDCLANLKNAGSAAVMIVLNRSLALLQNKINTYFNADKA